MGRCAHLTIKFLTVMVIGVAFAQVGCSNNGSAGTPRGKPSDDFEGYRQQLLHRHFPLGNERELADELPDASTEKLLADQKILEGAVRSGRNLEERRGDDPNFQEQLKEVQTAYALVREELRKRGKVGKSIDFDKDDDKPRENRICKAYEHPTDEQADECCQDWCGELLETEHPLYEIIKDANNARSCHCIGKVKRIPAPH